jgi:N-acetylglucosamine-6-phosphate deacetylase
MATGLSDGIYELGHLKVRVKGNLAQLVEDKTIAGSVTTLMDIVRTAVTQMKIPLESAVMCASTNPAKALGIYEEYGSISPGKYANLVLLNEDLSINRVLLRGRFLHQQ